LRVMRIFPWALSTRVEGPWGGGGGWGMVESGFGPIEWVSSEIVFADVPIVSLVAVCLIFILFTMIIASSLHQISEHSIQIVIRACQIII